MAHHYLFYISQNYSFEILRPIQEVIRGRGDKCAWFVEGNEVNLTNFDPDEVVLPTVSRVKAFNPRAVFVPGNWVPNFIPGLKVQVFHGLEYKKKGHFRIRDFFDLYCTQGELTTSRFKALADAHQNFHVVETGWCKLDPLFTTSPYSVDTDLPVILFAPTFSPNLTSALACLESIKQLVATGKHYWLVKFHPKMNPEWIKRYREIQADNFEIVSIDSCLPLHQRADVLLSDTSSMVGEFLLLNKPVVTYKNADPGDYLIDIQTSDDLEAAISQALAGDNNLMERIANYSQKLHPYVDGKSSQRILEAVDEFINTPVKLAKSRPANLFRSLKLRKKLGYWQR